MWEPAYETQSLYYTQVTSNMSSISGNQSSAHMFTPPRLQCTHSTLDFLAITGALKYLGSYFHGKIDLLVSIWCGVRSGVGGIYKKIIGWMAFGASDH